MISLRALLVAAFAGSLLTSGPAGAATVETWVDASWSMWGFFNARSIQPFVQQVDEAVRRATTNVVAPKVFITSKDLRFTVEPLSRIGQLRFGAYTQLDRAVEEARGRSVSILLLLTDNIQDDPNARPSALWEMFRRYNVAALFLMPGRFDFDGPIYPIGNWSTTDELQVALDRANGKRVAVVRMATPGKDSKFDIHYKGPHGLIAYGVLLDEREYPAFRRLVDTLLGKGLPALWVYPLDQRVVTFDEVLPAAGGFAKHVVPAVLRLEPSRNASNGARLALVDPRMRLYQHRQNSIHFDFGLRSELRHVRVGDDTGTREQVRLVSSTVALIDQASDKPVRGDAAFRVTPARLQAPLARDATHAARYRGEIDIRPLPQRGFFEALTSLRRTIRAEFSVDLSVPPTAFSLDAKVAEFFTADPLRQDRIYSPYADPVQVLHDRNVVIPLKIVAEAPFHLTGAEILWRFAVAAAFVALLVMVAVGVRRWLNRHVEIAVGGFPTEFWLHPGGEKPLVYGGSTIGTIRRRGADILLSGSGNYVVGGASHPVRLRRDDEFELVNNGVAGGAHERVRVQRKG